MTGQTSILRRAAVLVAALLTLAALAPIAETPPVGAATDVPVPDSIDRTGATDVTKELNDLFAGLAPGSTVVFPAGGRYRVEGVLQLLDRSNLTIDGNGSTFFALTTGSGATPPNSGYRRYWPRRREHFAIRRSVNVTLRDLTVHGANANAGATPQAYVPALEGQAGVSIAKSTNVVLDSVRIEDTYGDFVWIAGGSRSISVRNSTMVGSGRQGIAVVNATGVTVEDNDIREVARSVVDLEPAGRAVANSVVVRRNRVGNYRNFLLAAVGGGPGVNQTWLHDNQVDGGNGVSVAAGFWARQRRGLHILNNVGTAGTRAPSRTAHNGLIHRGMIQLTNLDGVEIRGNVQSVGGAPAVSTDGVCNLTVEDNLFPGASPAIDELAPCAPPA
jgi:Right handed beta helix region